MKAADPNFTRFWSAYPRKIAKKKAEKAWNALKPDAAMAERILAVLEERKAYEWVKPDLDRFGVVPKALEFIPYPATFLNSEDFTEEVEAMEDDSELPPLLKAMVKS